MSVSNRPQPVEPLWDLRGISKAFPGVQALDAVSIALYAGEIHALVGENGSGKSTLAKVLTGAHQPDSGKILFQGQPVTLRDPTAAWARGVAAIYQEFSLVPSLSVAENISLGHLPHRGSSQLVDWPVLESHAKEVLAQLGIHVDVRAPVQALSVAEQQLVEIAKAISADSRLLIMDEPTAALALHETRRLHELIRELAHRGRAILYISHRLHEVIGLADRVTILKYGRLVTTRGSGEFDLNAVVRLMVGAEIEEHYPKEHHTTSSRCWKREIYAPGTEPTASRSPSSVVKCSGWEAWSARAGRRSAALWPESTMSAPGPFS
jgi:ABC-type sugar transport system ATPase subunit